MEFRIERLTRKRLIGEKMTMSMLNNRTLMLWQCFMPRRREITDVINSNLFSIEVYSPFYFSNYNPDAEFTKWAAVEVSDIANIPKGMDVITLEGLYAVFSYKGNANQGAAAYQYIYETWLPNSDYQLDDRAHFAVMGAGYKNNSDDSEEELWIPIRLKEV